ncbi:MAG: J domain-containing protein, partial [Lachnospiraceae bacterium]|nr:J domain-containing protein [Lachnospiraceae bacterium]
MTKEEAFGILGIEPTRDEGAISEAYRKELKKHHPEEDQEGFKRVRSAYEEALRSLKETEDDGDISTVDFSSMSKPVSDMIRQAMDIYCDYSRRLDREVWEELLSNPVFMDFEYEVEARTALLRYLSEHFRLPAYIYKLIDDKLFIREHEAELNEVLPDNFLPFLINTAKNTKDGWEFCFDAIENYPKPDNKGRIDEFIAALLREIGKSSKDPEFAGDEALAALDGYGMTHPYLELLHMRAKSRKKEKLTQEEITRICELREKYPDDQRILNDNFVLLSYAGEDEILRSVCEDIIKRADEEEKVEAFAKYYANYHLGRILYSEGKRNEAIEKLENAMSISHSPAVTELLDKVGGELIDDYTGRDDLSEDEAVKLAEVYHFTDRAADGLSFFREHPGLCAERSEFYYHIACLHLMNEQAEELFSDVEKGLKLLETEKEEAEKDYI